MVHKKCHFFILWRFLQMLTNFYSIWPTVYRVNLQHSNYSYTRLTCIPLLHYLGETSQLYSNSFSNQSYTLPLHKLKVGLSIHTVGLHLSLKITASGQNVIFHLHRLGVYYVIQQVHSFATSVNQALPVVLKLSSDAFDPARSHPIFDGQLG